MNTLTPNALSPNALSPNRWIRAGLFALPVYAIVTAYATLRAQPDSVSDPEGWARFVSSTSYLVEHVLGSLVGTIAVIFGTFALGAYLAGSRVPRLAMWGMTLAITGHVLFTVPGVVSTFTTPAIGRAYLAGNEAAMTVDLSAATPAFALALLLGLVGNLLLGAAVWRSGRLPGWTGLLWTAGTIVFYLLGTVLGLATTGASLPTQPVGAALLLVAGAAMAWTAGRSNAHTASTSSTESVEPTPAAARVQQRTRS